MLFFCFKQKTAYEMRISDWSSDVCSSDLHDGRAADELDVGEGEHVQQAVAVGPHEPGDEADHEATGKPDDGDEYGEPRAAEQSRPCVDHPGPVEIHAGLRERACPGLAGAPHHTRDDQRAGGSVDRKSTRPNSSH